MLKVGIYDEFHCIADACTFSCCKDGWAVSLKGDEISAYLTDPYIKEGLDLKKKRMKMQENGDCHFLDENGLCKLVCKYGPDILSRTCTIFPRTHRNYLGVEEKLFSNACPKVLDILAHTPTPLSFVIEGEELTNEYMSKDTVQARDVLIDILQSNELPIWVRLYLVYSMSQKLEKCEGPEYATVLLNHSDKAYLNKKAEELSKLPCDMGVLLPRLHAVFNMVNGENKGKMYYDEYVGDYHDKDMEWNVEDWLKKRETFGEWLNKWQDFIENYCVNMAVAHLLVENLGILKNKAIMMMLEVAVSVYTVFLNHLAEKELTDTDIYNIFCYYARLFEHNERMVDEFIRSNTTKGLFGPGELYLMCKFMDL